MSSQGKLAAAIMLALAANARAELSLFDNRLKLEGFATFGMIKADDPQVTVKVDDRTSTGSTNDVRLDADSQISGQATVVLSNSVKGVVQLLAKKDDKSQFKPKVEWAYLSWQASDELDFKLGRSVAPIFLMSDYRNLFYAQTAARPSIAYSTNPITWQDGINVLWEPKVGSNNFTVDAFYGKTRLSVGSSVSIDFSKAWGIAGKWSSGPFSARLGYSSYDYKVTAPPIAGLIGFVATIPPAFCSNCAQLMSKEMDIEHGKSNLKTFGLAYDDEQYIAQAEWARREQTLANAPVTDSYYAMGGIRYGSLTPYLMYTNFKTKGDKLPFSGPAASPYADTLGFLRSTRLGIGSPDGNTYTLGLRWDLAPRIALKAQIDHMRFSQPELGSTFVVKFPQNIYASPALGLSKQYFDGRVNLYTLNLDMIF
ncbi:porin [Chitinimonas sp.]|uniref:porin n=1 Tax=Chitinimonas sp. TaxID=1934313 RepID=UPI0035B00EA4